MSIKYTQEFILEFQGLNASISSTYFDGKKIYRLEWPDYSVDFLSTRTIFGLAILQRAKKRLQILEAQ